MSLDLEALETSFDLIAPRGDELMDVFYARLFMAAPVVKPLFAGTDMARQKSMLLGALVLLRKSLRDLGAVVPKLHELGARHVAYGARPEYYPVVGSVLIASMAEVAGDAWTPEFERAWAAAFEVVAGAMLEGARARSSSRRRSRPQPGARAGVRPPTPARRSASSHAASAACEAGVRRGGVGGEGAQHPAGAGEGELVGIAPARGSRPSSASEP